MTNAKGLQEETLTYLDFNFIFTAKIKPVGSCFSSLSIAPCSFSFHIFWFEVWQNRVLLSAIVQTPICITDYLPGMVIKFQCTLRAAFGAVNRIWTIGDLFGTFLPVVLTCSRPWLYSSLRIFFFHFFGCRCRFLVSLYCLFSPKVWVDVIKTAFFSSCSSWGQACTFRFDHVRMQKTKFNATSDYVL